VQRSSTPGPTKLQRLPQIRNKFQSQNTRIVSLGSSERKSLPYQSDQDAVGRPWSLGPLSRQIRADPKGDLSGFAFIDDVSRNLALVVPL